MKKRALIVLFFACILLGATGLTEYLFYRQDEAVWVQNFENRLHKQEKWADDILKSFRDSVQIVVHLVHICNVIGSLSHLRSPFAVKLYDEIVHDQHCDAAVQRGGHKHVGIIFGL